MSARQRSRRMSCAPRERADRGGRPREGWKGAHRISRRVSTASGALEQACRTDRSSSRRTPSRETPGRAARRRASLAPRAPRTRAGGALWASPGRRRGRTGPSRRRSGRWSCEGRAKGGWMVSLPCLGRELRAGGRGGRRDVPGRAGVLDLVAVHVDLDRPALRAVADARHELWPREGSEGARWGRVSDRQTAQASRPSCCCPRPARSSSSPSPPRISSHPQPRARRRSAEHALVSRDMP